MANKKTHEKKSAYDLYVKQGKTAKYIADILNVAERTVGNWAKVGDWKQERDARNSGQDKLVGSLRRLISVQVDQLLELEEMDTDQLSNDELEKHEERCRSISDKMSKNNKALETAMKADEISFTNVVKVMDKFTEHLNQSAPKLCVQIADHLEDFVKSQRSKWAPACKIKSLKKPT